MPRKSATPTPVTLTLEQQREHAELRARLDAQQDAEHAAVAALLPAACQIVAAFGGYVDTRNGGEVDQYQPRLWIYFGRTDGSGLSHGTAELTIEVDRSAPLHERVGRTPTLVARTKTSSFSSADLDEAAAWAEALATAQRVGRMLLAISRGRA